jgi:hypothetical protein
MLLSPGNNAVTYFAFQFSAEMKKCIKQADICQMIEKACKLHTNSLILSTGEEVIQPKGWEGGCGEWKVLLHLWWKQQYHMVICEVQKIVSDNL